MHDHRAGTSRKTPDGGWSPRPHPCGGSAIWSRLVVALRGRGEDQLAAARARRSRSRMPAIISMLRRACQMRLRPGRSPQQREGLPPADVGRVSGRPGPSVAMPTSRLHRHELDDRAGDARQPPLEIRRDDSSQSGAPIVRKRLCSSEVEAVARFAPALPCIRRASKRSVLGHASIGAAIIQFAAASWNFQQTSDDWTLTIS